MAVNEEDLGWYRSQNGDSEGGTRSLVEMVDADKNNLYPDIGSASRLAGGSMIRKFFLANEHSTDSLLSPVIWVSEAPAGLTVEIGLGFDDGDDDQSDGGNMTAWGANSVIALVSDGADTRAVTVYGVNSAGDAVSESLTMNGATEVVGTVTWSKVWAVVLDTKDASRIVTIRQGAGGTVRGSLPINRAVSWLWVSALSQATGIALPDLLAGGEYGVWQRITWLPDTAVLRPAEIVMAVTES